MAEFLLLWGEREGFAEELRARRRAAEEARPSEAAAALTMQRCWRGSVAREEVTRKLFAGHLIQRVFRGFRARARVDHLRGDFLAEQERARQAFFATQFTRIVRGFLCRRKRNFYERKRTVAQWKEQGAALRDSLERQLGERLEAKRDEEELVARQKFTKATEGLHHLVSTRAQPGIYNPPYAVTADDVPSAFNTPLEVHLQDGARRFVRKHGLSSQRWPRPLSRQERVALRAVREVGGEAAVRGLRADVEGLERSGALRPLRPGRAGLPRTAVEMNGAVAMAVTGGVLGGVAPASSSAAGVVPGTVALAQAGAAEVGELEGAGMHGFEAVAARSIRRRRAAVPSKTGGAEGDRPPPFVDNRRSLQASAPYGVEVLREREEERYRRVLDLDAAPFAAGGRAREPRHRAGVHSTAPYDEPWKAARSTRELANTRESKALRVAGPDFVSTAGRVPSFEASERQRAAGRVPSSQAWVTAGKGTGGQPGATLKRAAPRSRGREERGGSAGGARPKGRGGAAGGGAAAVRALQGDA